MVAYALGRCSPRVKVPELESLAKLGLNALGPSSRQALLLAWGLVLVLEPTLELANWPWLPWVVEEGLPGSTAFLWLEQERDKGSILGLRKSI